MQAKLASQFCFVFFVVFFRKYSSRDFILALFYFLVSIVKILFFSSEKIQCVKCNILNTDNNNFLLFIFIHSTEKEKELIDLFEMFSVEGKVFKCKFII